MKKIYKYGLLRRPAGLGCQPKGAIKFEDASKKNDGVWSYVYYDRELTDEDLYDYEMVKIKEEKNE